MSTEGNTHHGRKSRINLEKTYPAEYVERLMERLSRMLEEGSDNPTGFSGSSPTSAPSPHSPAPTPTPAPAPPSPSPITPPSQPSVPTPPAPTSPSKPRVPNSPVKPSPGQSKFSNWGCELILLGNVLVWLLIGSLFHNLGNRNKYSRAKDKEVIERPYLRCPATDIWTLFAHVDTDTRLLDSRGTVMLDSLQQIYKDDKWLSFIAKKNDSVKHDQTKGTLKFLDSINYPQIKKSSKPKNMRMYNHLWFLMENYLLEDDYELRNDAFYGNRDKVNAAIAQFKKDSGLPADAKLDSKKVRELSSLWDPIYATRPLGIKKASGMKYVHGTSDSDSLINLLRRSGFIAEESKLTKRFQDSQYKDSKKAKLVEAAVLAGCEHWDYSKQCYHYDIPDDLETCLRAFQAYHGLNPDGLLDEKTIFALRQYAY